jgi:hypothetical protein
VVDRPSSRADRRGILGLLADSHSGEAGNLAALLRYTGRMEPASVEYAKGWGYEVTFPGEADPVEVSEADVDSEFTRRFAESDMSPAETDAARRPRRRS